MLSKEELINEILSSKNNLKEAYVKFNNTLIEYIKSFNDDVDFIFSFSENQSKESIKNYYNLSVQIAYFYRITSDATAKLSKDLISAYNLNQPEIVADIDASLKKQIVFEEKVSQFIKSCESEITKNKGKTSPKFLHKQAVELKQKLEILVLK